MPCIKGDREYILNLYGRLPLSIKEARGMYLYDEDGRAYLDFYSGIAVNLLGHQHPKVMEAIKNQLEDYIHLSNYFCTHAQVNLAMQLVQSSFAGKVFFANSGTEANEAMLKLARKYGRGISENKINFVSLIRGFHGRTFGGMSLTGNDSYKTQFGPTIEGITHVPINDVDALREAVDENTCGIIFEVIQGEGGLLAVSDKFIEAIKETAGRNKALILIDEVQTGLMRTGKLFAHEHFDITPDAVTLAKGLGGGLPLGAMLVRDTLEHVLVRGDHGSTFGGNPVACAAGSAIMKVLLEENFKESVNLKSAYLMKKLTYLKDKYPLIITEIRGMGLMIGFEVGDYAERIRVEAQESGLLLNITGKTVIRLLPALILEEKDIDLFLKIMDDVLSGM